MYPCTNIYRLSWPTGGFAYVISAGQPIRPMATVTILVCGWSFRWECDSQFVNWELRNWELEFGSWENVGL